MGLGDRYRLEGDLRPPKPVAVVHSAPTKISLKQRLSKGEVEWSPDFERVKNLARRPRNNPEEWEVWADELEQVGHPLAATVRGGVAGLVRDLTEALKRPEGTQALREVQALALWEGMLVGGLLGAIFPGGGKTLLGMLMPMALESKRACLFIPPDLRPQFFADWETYGAHWKLPNLAGGRNFVAGRPVLHVHTYAELSHPKSSAMLEEINPDLVMGDEIDALRNENARVRRFKRYFAEHPHTKFCGWSATVVATSIENFWHLLAIALGEGSPVPLAHREVKRWARALDPSDDEGYFMPGVLNEFCEPGESIRSGFQRRLVGTQGVVTTEEAALGIPLYFRQRKTKLPENVAKHLRVLRRRTEEGGWKRPDGEELRTSVEVVACAKQLALGLWLHWAYPKMEPREVIELWFERRQAWNRELRSVLANPRVHMDSPKLCENAAERWFNGGLRGRGGEIAGCPGCSRGPLEQHRDACRAFEAHPLWESMTYQAWIEVEDTVQPVTRVKWESEWLLEDAAAWAAEAPGIVWVDHPEFGHQLSRISGLPYYGGGEESAEEIIKEDGSRSIICSVLSNRKGKNLQAFNRNLFTSIPSSNDTIEQAVGRSFRSGQKAPSVSVDFYLHTPELEHSLDTAKARAVFVRDVMGMPQKLCYATFLGADSHEGVPLNPLSVNVAAMLEGRRKVGR